MPTDRPGSVIALARRETRHFDHAYVGIERLLLARPVMAQQSATGGR